MVQTMTIEEAASYLKCGSATMYKLAPKLGLKLVDF